ncbi:Protein-associating with the carboxyl-terminal domain of ezrin [Geranomyces michiganensis]|nr:Protein-associating with the carboxyl-terminal domain of ezrin [Geranomyces michiganensis]
MGASESRLLSGYTIQTTWPLEYTAFTVQRAVSKASASPVTVFSYKPPVGALAEDVKIIGRAVPRLRSIRHPGVVKFISAQADDKGVAIVTESVVPLSEMLPTFGPDDVAIGLFNVIKTIEFLHDQDVSHNNIQMSSIYVTEKEKKWVLAGMEFATGFDEAVADLLPKLHKYYPSDAIPPEDTPDGKSGQVPGLQPDSRDSYSLGKLITAIIKPMLASGTLSDRPPTEFRWQELQQFADRLMSPAWEDRPRIVDALRHPWFTGNVLINVVELFLRDIRVFDPDAKRARFQQLPNQLRSLSVATLTSHVLPIVLSESFASEPGVEVFFEQLFVPRTDDGARGILPLSSYCELVLPFVEAMLRVRTYNVRVLMLSLFNCYFTELQHWDDTLLQSVIIPELLLGLEEKDDTIYILSLSALTEAISQLCLYTPNPYATPAMSESSLEDSPQRPSLGAKSPSQDGRLGVGSLQTAQTGDIPKAVRKKLVSSPTRAKLGERPPVTRNVSVGLLAGANESDAKDSSLASVRMKRHSGVPASGSKDEMPPRAPATAGGVDGPSLQHTPRNLVEESLIPHVLSICVQESATPEQQWLILDSVIMLWKNLCVAEATNKGPPDVREITQSIVNCFHLILKVLPPEMKTECYCVRLVGDATGRLESPAIHWLARTIELGTPFIQDENRDVRREISQAVLKVITVVSTAMDRAPTITRKRQGERDVASRLRKVYARLARTNTVFPRTGPRIAASGAVLPVRSLSRDSVLPDASQSVKSSWQDLAGAPSSAGPAPPDADSWGNEHWGADDEDNDADQRQPQPAAAPVLAPVETKSPINSPAINAPNEPAEVPDPLVSKEEQEEREAEKLARLEKLKAKREAREAELRRKRELRRASNSHLKTQSVGSADGLERRSSAGSDGMASATPRTSEIDARHERLPELAPPLTPPVAVSLLDIVGRDAAQSIPALVDGFTSTTTETKKEEIVEENFFEDMQPVLPPPTMIVLDRLAQLAAAISLPPTTPPLTLSTNAALLPLQGIEAVNVTPPPLTPASSRLAVIDAVEDGAGWGDDGLSDFE